MRRALTVIGVLALAWGAAGCDDGGAPAGADVSDVSADTDADGEAPGPPDLTVPAAVGEVRAGVVEDAAALIGGPKAEGQLGDVRIDNAQGAWIIEGARPAGGYRYQGGHVVDAGPQGGDRFGELWFAWNLTVFRPDAVEVVSDGRDGLAHVRARGRTAPYPWPDSFLRPLLAPPPTDLAVTYDYRLGPDDEALALTIRLTNDGDEAVDLDWPFVAANQGDGVANYIPERGLGEVAGVSHAAWLGAVGLDVGYGVFHDVTTLTGLFTFANLDLLQLPAFSLAPGASRELRLWYATTDGGTGALPRLHAELAGGPATGALEGTVDLDRADEAWVAVTDAEGADVVALAPVRGGRFAAEVPAGQWRATAWARGRGPGPAAAVSVAADETTSVDLDAPAPARVMLDVRDGDGAPIPARVIFTRADGGASGIAPEAVRLAGEALPPGVVATALHIPGEANEVPLPVGALEAVAARGFNWELDRQSVDLRAGDALTVAFTLERAVDAEGWSAADLHLHGLWSSDSSVPYAARARQAAADGVDLPILTEHVYVGDLGPTIADEGLDAWVATVPGQEVTTFEYGHFNAFPLVFDPEAPSWGGVFEHGHAGAGLFDAMRAQHPGEVVVQVNHPRGSVVGSYLEHVGWDRQLGAPTERTERWTTDWDLLEVFNGGCLDREANVEARADWIALTNLGLRKGLSAGSDEHYSDAPIGYPRVWVQVDRAAVAADPQALVAPLRERRSFVSCGPFVRFAALDGAGLGGLAGVDADGEVQLAITVEAPTWLDVARVDLLENGEVVETFDLRERAAPDPSRPARRLDTAVTVAPEADAWYAVEVFGEGDLAPLFPGDAPYALTNPIEVDADGDGAWTPPGLPAAPTAR